MKEILEGLIHGVFSGVDVRPILVKGKRLFQISEQKGTQVFHRNVTKEECQTFLESKSQGILYTVSGDYHLAPAKHGKPKFVVKPASKKMGDLSHNRKKAHLLQEGKPLPFLIELGLMNPQGRILPQKMDKFRQINRFLEMVEDVLEEEKEIKIVDFGCGKGYLTFALYHFLSEEKGLSVQMTGVDRREDLILSNRRLAETAGYRGLEFHQGDIASFVPTSRVDMVIALHACDTATDDALQKAIAWEAKVILAAPCCHKEFSKQIASEELEAILRHGLLRERLSAMATDAMRAERLEAHGYHTQILEFIAVEHTPQNLLIRAVKGNSQEKRDQAGERLRRLEEAVIDPKRVL